MKNIISILLSFAMILSSLIMLTSCGGTSIQEEWSTVMIGDKLPTPQKGKLNSGSNLDDYFSGGIEKVDREYYEMYKNECIDMGYTVEATEQDGRYEAFNSDGYEISMYFHNNRISINFSSPEELIDLIWPTVGIGANLPKPKATIGKVLTDSSDCFEIIIGDTSLDEYNEYINICQQEGFIVDYNRDDTYYYATNADGYRLNATYEGCNRVEIMIQTPKKEDNAANDTLAETEVMTIVPKEPNSMESSTDGLSEDFKTAMDGYEAFFDEYVDFMKKYKESNGTDLSLFLDYSNYVSKYAEMLADFEKWENCELSNEELAYYMQVQNRITQKLLEVAE